MERRWGARLGPVVLAAVVALAAGCGGTGSTSGGEDQGQQPAGDTMPEPVGAAEPPVTAAPGEEPMGGPSGDCGGQITLVEVNAPLDITMPDIRIYVCVSIIPGASDLRFEISEMTAPLNLYVGHPGLAELQAGGDGFWASENGGRDDESIVIEPGPDGSVESGIYFIEVSGGASADGAEFVLTVTMG